jgi:peptide deformylase
MKDAQGAGLAAPQVGESIQLVIFGVDKNERYPEAEEVPFTVLINPVITPLNQEKEDDWEGCLSVPGMRGVVPRYKTINYKGFDQYGNEIDRDVEGFHARVVQHECDHLFGILYPSRIENMKLFGFHDEIFAE